MPNKKVAVVTGANRGIGFEICRQLAAKGVTVALTARSAKSGQAARDQLREEGLDVRFLPLDVTDEGSVRNLAGDVEKELGGVDILINNAALNLDRDRSGLNADVETVRKTMETNVYGPLRMCQALVPLMKKRGAGRIINVSSRMGATSHISGGYPGYRISKAALNALTLILADELREMKILVNAIHPGWVKTKMGGRSAPSSVEEGADTGVWLALQPDAGLTGKLFMDRKIISW
jgi:NAD(P)-dependent dehydrogenase (short-subunit alcohol dehydrogenase family)